MKISNSLKNPVLVSSLTNRGTGTSEAQGDQQESQSLPADGFQKSKKPNPVLSMAGKAVGTVGRVIGRTTRDTLVGAAVMTGLTAAAGGLGAAVGAAAVAPVAGTLSWQAALTGIGVSVAGGTGVAVATSGNRNKHIRRKKDKRIEAMSTVAGVAGITVGALMVGAMTGSAVTGLAFSAGFGAVLGLGGSIGNQFAEARANKQQG